MTQMKFVQMAHSMQPDTVFDNGHGVIVVVLRHAAQIRHEYKKNNRMSILFIEQGIAYEIPNENVLEDIYAIHLGNKQFIEKAMKYCKENLKQI